MTVLFFVRHMRGDTTNSPFVSVLRDADAGAASTDPWLRTIITGQPGGSGAAQASDLGTFFVPSKRLVSPRETLRVGSGSGFGFQPNEQVSNSLVPRSRLPRIACRNFIDDEMAFADEEKGSGLFAARLKVAKLCGFPVPNAPMRRMRSSMP